jgi:hypothetical protein
MSDSGSFIRNTKENFTDEMVASGERGQSNRRVGILHGIRASRAAGAEE